VLPNQHSSLWHICKLQLVLRAVMIDGLRQHEIHVISLTARHLFLWAPRFHPLIIIYLHLKINQRPSIPLPPFDCITLFIYPPMMLMCSYCECVFSTPQIPVDNLFSYHHKKNRTMDAYIRFGIENQPF
jgi:hypothetical protein